MPSPLCVHNEVGRLRKVLLHRPGNELLNLSPSTLEPLLFDDIPFLRTAQAEHDAFAGMLRDEGVEVLYLDDLLAQTLDATPGLRRDFTDDYLTESGLTGTCVTGATRELLDGIADTREFVRKVICGIRLDELNLSRKESMELSDFVSGSHSGNPDLTIDPMPNLYFTRDGFTVVGHGVNVNYPALIRDVPRF